MAGRHARPDRAGHRGAALAPRPGPAAAGGARRPRGGRPPALYYLLLARLDPAWELAGRSNAAGAMPEWSWPWWAVALTLAPLAVPAALAYRLPAPSWQELARARVAAGGAGRLPRAGRHVPLPRVPGARAPALDPGRPRRAERLAAPRAAGGRRARRADEPPGHGAQARGVGALDPQRRRPLLDLPTEGRALRFLESDPRPGGVLGPVYAGYMLPETTGRETGWAR